VGAALSHDQYGKALLKAAFPLGFVGSGPSVRVNYGHGGHARIDGVLNGDIAVEIESRASKQVRGALVDLLIHTASRKLLVLLPVHMANIQTTAQQCRYVLGKYLDQKEFLVIILTGTGAKPQLSGDIATVTKALKGKGWI
jgi:hypothetical protein